MTNEKPPIDFSPKLPNIFVAGESGSGKSSSIRTLPPSKTIILSTENEALPFRGGMRFKYLVGIRDFFHFEKRLVQAINSDKPYIVVESWTSLAEMAYNAIVRPVEKIKNQVQDAWQEYKSRLHDILVVCKQADKIVIFLGVDTYVQNDAGVMYRMIDCQGSLRGRIEKEFQIVFWTHVADPVLEPDPMKRYQFCTNRANDNRAKSPAGYFPELYIPNDLGAVVRRVENFAHEDVDPADPDGLLSHYPQ